jgi:hypothetical protein
MTTITTAANEYAKRPADERYSSLQSLIDTAQYEQDRSAERGFNLKELSAVAGADGLRLAGPRGTAVMTHWSFGQLARMIGAPGGYLRSLPATIAADAINYGIQETDAGTKATLLVRAPNGRPEPTIRSITSDTYGRLWDAPLYRGLQGAVGSLFDLPPTWAGGADGPRSGAYRGDRDSFVVLVNGGSIVNDPSARNGNGQMWRGLMIRNSEVGAAAVTIERILFQFICGNHNFWGAVIDKRFKRRHVGTHVLRDVIREVGSLAYTWANRSAAQDEAIIRGLIDHELASTKESVIDELRAMGASKETAEQAYDHCERSEIFTAPPRSYWGINQAITQISQQTEYQNDRFELDQLAAKVLARGARLVAA